MYKDRGGVLVEFLISLPLLMLFFFGLAQLGRYLSIALGVSNAAYSMALIGSSAPPSGVAGAMDLRVETHLQSMSEQIKNDLEFLGRASEVDYHENNTVTVSLAGTMTKKDRNMFFDLLNTTQTNTLTVPILDTFTALPNSVNPGNSVNNCYYGCDKVSCSSDINNSSDNCSVAGSGEGEGGGASGGGGSGGGGGGSGEPYSEPPPVEETFCGKWTCTTY